MTTPRVSLLLCTVRDDAAYADHPEWHVIGKLLDDLSQQTDQNFELVVVDGLYHRRKAAVAEMAAKVGFEVRHVPPRASSPWVRMKKVAICAYRNTGIATARGSLVVNLDDCCELPPNYVDMFWRAWSSYGVAVAMTWPRQNDYRRPGRVDRPGAVYGFGSYPRELALQLNGYDEAYDGAQGLEDTDWSTRLFNAGLPQALIDLPGFNNIRQVPHSAEAINAARPRCKCCNAAWNTERVWRQVQVANTRSLWSAEALHRLVGPCQLLRDGMCAHHFYRNPCAYLDTGFPTSLDPEAAVIFQEPPVIDLRREALEAQS